jgi:hypothetical protein
MFRLFAMTRLEFGSKAIDIERIISSFSDYLLTSGGNSIWQDTIQLALMPRLAIYLRTRLESTCHIMACSAPNCTEFRSDL